MRFWSDTDFDTTEAQSVTRDWGAWGAYVISFENGKPKSIEHLHCGMVIIRSILHTLIATTATCSWISLQVMSGRWLG